MSDSDDDWFTKDIDELAPKVKKVVDSTESGATSLETQSNVPLEMLKEEFGGCYIDNNKPNKKKSYRERTQESQQRSQSVSNKTEAEEYIQTIPLLQIIQISKLSPLEIYIEICNKFQEFFETIYQIKLSDRKIQALIQIISKLCHLPLPETRKYILSATFTKCETFWNNTLEYVKVLTEQKNKINKNKLLSDSNLNDLVSDILEFIKYYTRTFKFNENFLVFVERLNTIFNCNDGNKCSAVGLKLNAVLNEIKASREAKIKIFDEIYPTIEDLKEVIIPPDQLRSNLMTGSFKNVNNYLETHLPLLKEDFISPLRHEIKKFMNNPIGKNFKNKGVYHKVSLHVALPHRQNVTSDSVLIDIKPKENNININELIKSKQFMLGSLLCLAGSASYDDLILMVVTNRETHIRKGLIQVDFLNICKNFENIFDKEFILFESEIFFEPYHHVYNALKNLTEDNFPLKRYIIDCNVTNDYPKYIPADLNDISYKIGKFKFNLKNFETWPSPEQLQMNVSQVAALRSALTKEFCVIQGPPGTGKTFIGLQIVSALLRNTDLQILVVSHTNSALDQILTGILKHTKDIARLGSMSKTTELDAYNVRNMPIEEGDKNSRTAHYKTKTEYKSILQKFRSLQIQFETCSNVTERTKILNEIVDLQEQLRGATRRLEEIKQVLNYQHIKKKRVIGMTTTYAARCQCLLQLLGTPIVLIEETAEILESHTIVALTEKTQQLIMIGDHQQLRPQTSVFALAKKYKLDISLFERMLNNKMNSVQLTVQHRMHPEIANLIRPEFYNTLTDSENVNSYPKINGICSNLYFMDHKYPENNTKNEVTKSNQFEALFIIQLCRYLIQQKYHSSEITILTPYMGQVILLRNEKKQFSELKDVSISIVDTFQGRENRIILLSLVRSNDRREVGFLGVLNRLAVALSRAREGLFIIGNMELLLSCRHWHPINEILVKQNAIGDSIPFQCETHGNITHVNIPENFPKFGGCNVSECGIMFDVHKKCQKQCHTKMYPHELKKK